MIEYHKKRNTWNKEIDYLIALTDFSKSKFVEGGIKAENIKVKPNFINDPVNSVQKVSNGESYFLFIGRVAKEKGILTLLSAWKNFDEKLIIIGEGPLENKVKSESSSNKSIEFLGKKDRKEVLKILNNAKALLFPSEWYEGFPMVVLEAFAMSVPVITSDIGSQKEIVSDRKTGLHFKMGDPKSLAEKVRLISNDCELRSSLGNNCRAKYLASYTPDTNIKELLAIYESAAKKKKHKFQN